jgi:colanic acid/amylovoran biosynthesis glycosyltransferase
MTTAVLQALATGLPCITTNHGAFSEQIIEGKNGFLVREGDYKMLAEKILFYFDRQELWPEMGRFGREHVKKHFNFMHVINQQISVYQSIFDK